MAAGKVSVVRRVDLSHVSNVCGSGSYGYVNGENRFVVRTDEFVDDGKFCFSPPQKRRKFCVDDYTVESLPVKETNFCYDDDDDDHEPGQLDEEDFSRAPNILMSRWACDGDDDGDDVKDRRRKEKESSGRRSSPESGVTQKDGSDVSVSVSDCVMGVFSGDDCSESEFDDDDDDNDNGDRMEVDLSDDDDEGYRASELSFGCEDESKGGGNFNGGRNMLKSCRNVFDYEKVGKISEGSYGIVFKAKDKESGEVVALKKMKMGTQREGFPVYYLREINTLMALNHPSIVNVREVVVDETDNGFDNIYMVMDYVEHDLKALMQARKQPFRQSEVKFLMLQLLEGIKYLHDNWVLHRDLKTSNLLVNDKGGLKICDFGMARQYGSPLKPYTSLVVTLWYRAPELLLGAKEYSTAVDMWSVGCIMAEMLTNKPLFDGKTEVEQLDKIFRTLGTPNEKIWPGYSQLPGLKANFVNQPYNHLHKKFPRASFTSPPALSDLGLDLLGRLLTYDPETRISAEEALSHPWFKEVPLPNSKEFMPTLSTDKIGVSFGFQCWSLSPFSSFGGRLVQILKQGELQVEMKALIVSASA